MAITEMFDLAMRHEREGFPGAGASHYERKATRRDCYVNGYQD